MELETWKERIKVDGKTVKVGSLEVVSDIFDYPGGYYPSEKFDDLGNVGDGWRLPTKEELIFLYKNKDKLTNLYDGDSRDAVYWSSTECDCWAGYDDRYKCFAACDFSYGKGSISCEVEYREIRLIVVRELGDNEN